MASEVLLERSGIIRMNKSTISEALAGSDL